MKDQTHSGLERLEVVLRAELDGESSNETAYEEDSVANAELEERLTSAIFQTRPPRTVSMAVDRILAKGELRNENRKRLVAALNDSLRGLLPRSGFLQDLLEAKREQDGVSLETLASTLSEAGHIVNPSDLRDIERGVTPLITVKPELVGVWAVKLKIARITLERATSVAMQHDDPEQFEYNLAAESSSKEVTPADRHRSYLEKMLLSYDGMESS